MNPLFTQLRKCNNPKQSEEILIEITKLHKSTPGVTDILDFALSGGYLNHILSTKQYGTLYLILHHLFDSKFASVSIEKTLNADLSINIDSIQPEDEILIAIKFLQVYYGSLLTAREYQKLVDLISHDFLKSCSPTHTLLILWLLSSYEMSCHTGLECNSLLFSKILTILEQDFFIANCYLQSFSALLWKLSFFSWSFQPLAIKLVRVPPYQRRSLGLKQQMQMHPRSIILLKIKALE